MRDRNQQPQEPQRPREELDIRDLELPDGADTEVTAGAGTVPGGGTVTRPNRLAANSNETVLEDDA